MSRKIVPISSPSLIALATVVLLLLTLNSASATGPTTNPWPSFRHDLLNSGAATDSGYPDTLNILWSIDREARSWGSGTCRIQRPVSGGRWYGFYSRNGSITG